jgi:hypothetical protein
MMVLRCLGRAASCCYLCWHVRGLLRVCQVVVGPAAVQLPQQQGQLDVGLIM